MIILTYKLCPDPLYLVCWDFYSGVQGIERHCQALSKVLNTLNVFYASNAPFAANYLSETNTKIQGHWERFAHSQNCPSGHFYWTWQIPHRPQTSPPIAAPWNKKSWTNMRSSPPIWIRYGIKHQEQGVLNKWTADDLLCLQLSTVLSSLAERPTAEVLDGLRMLERKTSLVCTLLKASVYSIVLQQQIYGGDEGDGQG